MLVAMIAYKNYLIVSTTASKRKDRRERNEVNHVGQILDSLEKSKDAKATANQDPQLFVIQSFWSSTYSGNIAKIWSSPREIPQSFRLCGKQYIFCGALLNDRDRVHFRALVKIEDKFAMYDGMRDKSRRITWHHENTEFGQSFTVGKAWYVERKTADSIQQLSHDVEIGVPDGISIKHPLKHHCRHEHICQSCKGTIQSFKNR